MCPEGLVLLSLHTSPIFTLLSSGRGDELQKGKLSPQNGPWQVKGFSDHLDACLRMESGRNICG